MNTTLERMPRKTCMYCVYHFFTLIIITWFENIFIAKFTTLISTAQCEISDWLLMSRKDWSSYWQSIKMHNGAIVFHMTRSVNGQNKFTVAKVMWSAQNQLILLMSIREDKAIKSKCLMESQIFQELLLSLSYWCLWVECSIINKISLYDFTLNIFIYFFAFRCDDYHFLLLSRFVSRFNAIKI